MSFILGPAQLALGIAGLTLALRNRRPGFQRSEPQRGEIGLLTAFAAAAAGGAWLATTASAPLWSRLELLQYFAYPWRALMLPALFLPLLALPALATLGRRRWALALLLAAVAGLNLRHTEPKGYLKFDDEFYAPESIARKGLNTTTREEYEPRWVAERPPFQEERLRGLLAPIEAQELERRSHREKHRVLAAATTPVETAAFFYPGWTVLVDGERVNVTPVPVRGTMRFDLPAGEHQVVIELRPTPVRRWSAYVSAAALVLCVFTISARGALKARRSRRDKGSRAAPVRDRTHPEPSGD
jgi:hypothetical protein